MLFFATFAILRPIESAPIDPRHKGLIMNQLSQFSIRNSLKLPQIICKNNQALAPGMSGNMQIIHPDGLSALLQISTDIFVMLCRFLAVLQNF